MYQHDSNKLSNILHIKMEIMQAGNALTYTRYIPRSTLGRVTGYPDTFSLFTPPLQVIKIEQSISPFHTTSRRMQEGENIKPSMQLALSWDWETSDSIWCYGCKDVLLFHMCNPHACTGTVRSFHRGRQVLVAQETLRLCGLPRWYDTQSLIRWH
jgi:hypothetical protein